MYTHECCSLLPLFMYLVVEAGSSSQRNFSQSARNLSLTVRKQGLRASPDSRFNDSIHFMSYKWLGRWCAAFLFLEMDNPYNSDNEFILIFYKRRIILDHVHIRLQKYLLYLCYLMSLRHNECLPSNVAYV